MTERRPLVEGLKSLPPEQRTAEEAFVYGGPRNSAPETKPRPIASSDDASTSAQARPGLLPQMYNRVPITTRARPEMARALKRASLQRQLDGTEPFHVQDIMEVALETWLREKGYVE
jgi:hypothetical protein